MALIQLSNELSHLSDKELTNGAQTKPGSPHRGTNAASLAAAVAPRLVQLEPGLSTAHHAPRHHARSVQHPAVAHRRRPERTDATRDCGPDGERSQHDHIDPQSHGRVRDDHPSRTRSRPAGATGSTVNTGSARLGSCPAEPPCSSEGNIEPFSPHP